MKNITWQLGKTASHTTLVLGSDKWEHECVSVSVALWAAQSLIIDKDATLAPCPRCSRPAPITLLLLRLTQSQLQPQLGLLFHSRGDWCQQIVSSSCLLMFILLMQKSEGWSIQFIIINFSDIIWPRFFENIILWLWWTSEKVSCYCIDKQ